jgi:cytochrome c-type biogenesis protein CcmE
MPEAGEVYQYLSDGEFGGFFRAGDVVIVEGVMRTVTWLVVLRLGVAVAVSSLALHDQKYWKKLTPEIGD